MLFKGNVEGDYISGTLESSKWQNTKKGKWEAIRDPSIATPPVLVRRKAYEITKRLYNRICDLAPIVFLLSILNIC